MAVAALLRNLSADVEHILNTFMTRHNKVWKVCSFTAKTKVYSLYICGT